VQKRNVKSNCRRGYKPENNGAVSSGNVFLEIEIPIGKKRGVNMRIGGAFSI